MKWSGFVKGILFGLFIVLMFCMYHIGYRIGKGWDSEYSIEGTEDFVENKEDFEKPDNILSWLVDGASSDDEKKSFYDIYLGSLED